MRSCWVWRIPQGDSRRMFSPAGCRSSCRNQDFLPLYWSSVSGTEMCWRSHMEVDWLEASCLTLKHTNIPIQTVHCVSSVRQTLSSLLDSCGPEDKCCDSQSDLLSERTAVARRKQSWMVKGWHGQIRKGKGAGRSSADCFLLCSQRGVNVLFVFQSVPIGPTDPAATEDSVLMGWEETEPAAAR